MASSPNPDSETGHDPAASTPVTDHEPAATTSVTCPAGTLTGLALADGSLRFHSIPVAEFDSAYAPAHPAADSSDPVDCTKPRPGAVGVTIACPGRAAGDFAASTIDRPVIVYIHGGGFDSGDHEFSEMHPDSCVADGAVVVSVGYRLGLAGFAHFREEKPGMYRGIEDCALVLEWIQHNIAAFGGDPTNVTLIGHSAGAAIVLWLARRDHYRGAFRRAIAASPAFPREPWDARRSLYERMYGGVIGRSQLEKASAERVRRGYGRIRARMWSDLALGPAPWDPAELASVPLIITTARDEMLRHPGTRRIDRLGFGRLMVRACAGMFGLTGAPASFFDAGKKLDREAGSGAAAFRRLIGDSTIRRWAQYTADDAPGSVWLGEFVGGDNQAATHGAELPLLFGTGPIHDWLMRISRGDDPGWRQYSRSARATGALRLSDQSIHEESDPLKYVRLAFQPI